LNLRKYAAGKPCMIRIPGVCNRNPETTVLAHFRMTSLSGLGLKAPDCMGSWACSECHLYVDTHHDSETQLAFAKGVFRTQYRLHSEGVLDVR